MPIIYLRIKTRTFFIGYSKQCIHKQRHIIPYIEEEKLYRIIVWIAVNLKKAAVKKHSTQIIKFKIAVIIL